MQYTPHRWGFSVGNEIAIDFLIGLLLVDGLRVDPFVAHPARSGDLHRQGLTAGEWLEWLRRVAYARLLAGPDAEIDPLLEWQGTPRLKATLANLWEDHKASLSELWHSRPDLSRGLFEDRAHRIQLFKRDLLGADRSYGLPMLRVFKVHYPAPVLFMATPDVAVLGDGYGALEPAELVRSIADAAEQQRLMHGRPAGEVGE